MKATMKTLKAAAKKIGATVEDDGLTIEIIAPDGKVFESSDSETIPFDYYNKEQRKDAIRDAIAEIELGVY